jgi:hypothetical protein
MRIINDELHKDFIEEEPALCENKHDNNVVNKTIK